MPYIDLAGLSRFASLEKDALRREYAVMRGMQWLRTEKAGAVSLWPVGGTQLKPVVDFLFTETPPASGAKGPENPSTIAGVSSVLLSQIGGKNLLAYNFEGLSIADGTTKTISGLTISNDKGVYTFSGQATSQVNIYITHITEEPNKLKLLPGTYTLSGYTSPTGTSAGDVRVAIYYPDGTSSAQICYAGSKTFTVSGTEPVTCNVYIRSTQGIDYGNGFVCRPQLERGSEATAFEPSYVTRYTIPLGNTYYGGTLDVASGVMTVTWHGYVFDGTESYWVGPGSAGTYKRYSFTTDKPAPSGSALAPVYSSEICTHFSVNNSVNDGIEHFIVYGNQVAFYAVQTTLADWKAWLVSQKSAGHPLAVTYPLATPYTVQLSPVQISALAQTDKYTPRLNTVYSDASAMQVGYVKSPIRDEYELQQAVAAQGGNV